MIVPTNRILNSDLKHVNLLKNYYRSQIQYGRGMPDIYDGSSLQVGHGFGDILSTISKYTKPFIKPLIKKGVKKLGKSAVNTGANILEDIIDGKNLKNSAKKRTAEQFEKLKKESVQSIKNVLGGNITMPPALKKRKINNTNKKKIKKNKTKKNKKVKRKKKTKKILKKKFDNFGTY